MTRATDSELNQARHNERAILLNEVMEEKIDSLQRRMDRIEKFIFGLLLVTIGQLAALVLRH